MSLEKIVANLVQKMENRFYGKYRSFVVDNADPEQLGRLKLQVPSVLGQEIVTGWAMPCVPYGGTANQGFLFIPEVGAGVWVEFEEGDLEFPIWVGTFWSKPEGSTELPKPNSVDGSEQESVQNPPTCKIIKTKKGHTIQLEDADEKETILIMNGTNGHRILLNQEGVTISDKSSNLIKIEDQGVTISDKSGNFIKLEDQGITCSVSPNKKIKLTGEGEDKRVCLDGLIDWLLSHKHIGNMGAPTPLSPESIPDLTVKIQMPQSGILSDVVKAE